MTKLAETKQMYLKCAHPDCLSDFDHRQGRLFRLRNTSRNEQQQQPSHWHAVKHFWLCARCCAIYTIEEHKALGALLVQRQETLAGGDPFYYVLQRNAVAQAPPRKGHNRPLRRRRKTAAALESIVASVG